MLFFGNSRKCNNCHIITLAGLGDVKTTCFILCHMSYVISVILSVLGLFFNDMFSNFCWPFVACIWLVSNLLYLLPSNVMSTCFCLTVSGQRESTSATSADHKTSPHQLILFHASNWLWLCPLFPLPPSTPDPPFLFCFWLIPSHLCCHWCRRFCVPWGYLLFVCSPCFSLSTWVYGRAELSYTAKYNLCKAELKFHWLKWNRQNIFVYINMGTPGIHISRHSL